MKPLGTALLLVGTVLAIVVLREETMTRHTPVPRDSEMHLVVRASSNVESARLDEKVQSLLLLCQLEVATDAVAPPDPLGDDRFLLRIAPALDHSDQRQIVGCLEDAVIDRVQARVLSVTQVAPGTAPALPAD